MRSSSLLRNLLDLRCEVHLFTFSSPNEAGRNQAFPGVARSCIIPKKAPSRISGTWALIRGLLTGTPMDIRHTITADVLRSFADFTARDRFDVMIFDQLCAFEFSRAAQRDKALVVMNSHNAEFAAARELFTAMKRLDRRIAHFLNYLLVRSYEPRMLRTADRVIHVSEADMNRFDPDIRAKSIVIPNTLPYKRPFSRTASTKKAVLFVGSMSHYANVEGISRFINDVWPEIYGKRHDVRLLIVGGKPPANLTRHHNRMNIHILGYVDDLTDLYRQASLSITPINIGSGSRLKILESMMFGTLNIASPKGADGLPVEHGKNIVIAEGGCAWRDNILYYLEHEEERLQLEKAAHEFVEQRFYYAAYRDTVRQCLTR